LVRAAEAMQGSGKLDPHYTLVCLLETCADGLAAGQFHARRRGITASLQIDLCAASAAIDIALDSPTLDARALRSAAVTDQVVGATGAQVFTSASKALTK
jgi:hypothetical protein